MKKIKIQSILTAVAGLFLATSCSSSFLDTEPTDAVSSDQVAVAGNAERPVRNMGSILPISLMMWRFLPMEELRLPGI